LKLPGDGGNRCDLCVKSPVVFVRSSQAPVELCADHAKLLIGWTDEQLAEHTSVRGERDHVVDNVKLANISEPKESIPMFDLGQYEIKRNAP